MKIIIVGVLNKKKSTNASIRNSFRNLGCKTVDFNYRSIDDKELRLFQLAKTERPNCVFICKGNGFKPSYIDELNKITKTWYFIADPLETIKSIDAIEYAKRATWCSATSSEVYNEFKKVNKNAYHTIEGFDPEVFKPVTIQKEYDVIFAGKKDSRREKIVNMIRDAGFNIKVYGFEEDTRIFLDKLNEELNKSKLILNVCRSEIFSNRVTEGMGSGGVVLTTYCSDLISFFNPHISIVENHIDDSWNKYDLIVFNKDNLIHTIELLLSRDDVREQISINARKKSMEYTWDNQIRKILKIIK